MFAKRLPHKATHHHHHHHHQHNLQSSNVASADLAIRIAVHYGIPSTASILAFDSIQRLLAIGTLDGRIKVIGGNGIEGLLRSPKELPYKYLEFLTNQGFLISISTDNDIQVWDLENRIIASCLQWDCNITAFSVTPGSHFMYVGDENALFSVLKFEAEDGKLFQLPYRIPVTSITEAAGVPSSDYQPIVGVLPQPCSSGHRVLIAYENGLLIIWDVSEARIVLIRGNTDLELKNEEVDSSSEVNADLSDDASENQLEEKEISALCWASSNGTILAVGYIDGDILLWNTTIVSVKGQQAQPSPSSVVKLQLSSAERRLPVIVLYWSENNRSHNNCDGKLFIYGGDKIGFEEVLTVLSLEWSPGMETIRCVDRVDLTLHGSFADMILLPAGGGSGSDHNSTLFVLTNPGQIHFYEDDVCSSTVLPQQEKKLSLSAVEFPTVIPIADPYMTVTNLTSLTPDRNSSKEMLETASAMKRDLTPVVAGDTKWPLTGGIPSQLSFTDIGVERVYIAGYQDGSVRIWDATFPVLSLICILQGEIPGINIEGSSALVSAVEFCFHNSILAVGKECGLVHLHKLSGICDGTSLLFITQTARQVCALPQGKGSHCIAVFSFLVSRVRTLQFANQGTKLAVGFENGCVAVLDLSSLSVVFLSDTVSGSSSPLISLTLKAFSNARSNVNSPKKLGQEIPVKPADELMLILTRDARINVIDGVSGKSISSRPMHLKKDSTAISMYVIESGPQVGLVNKKEPQPLANGTTNEAMQSSHSLEINPNETQYSTEDSSFLEETLLATHVLLCCEDSLSLYSMKSVLQGDNKPIRKVKLSKPCCWTTTFKKDEKVCGLVLLYQTGIIEIRSVPDLELVEERSLMSIMRWNFKPSMEKTMASSDSGQIVLANGCELAFISLLASENEFRIPESLPCLHDKVLAAAADAAISVSSNQKKKKGTTPRILGGIVKGFKGGKPTRTVNHSLTHLEGVFSKPPFGNSSQALTNNQEVVELSIDEIEIDDPLPVASSHKVKNSKKDKETEKDRLFEGGSASDINPRVRTHAEIMVAYGKAGDATSPAEYARNKLLERQEKLERINKRTEELQSGAEDFAALADELVKTMEGRKWWKI